MQYALLAASLFAACSSVYASPIAQAAGIAGNVQLAITENQQFNQLKANSPCNANQISCIQGDLAQCVGGKFLTTACAGGSQCFSLPLVNKVGTSVTCTTAEDAARRMNAGSVQELQALIEGISPVPPVPTGTAAPPVGTGTAGLIGTGIPKKPVTKTIITPPKTSSVSEKTPTAKASTSSQEAAQPTTTKNSPAKPTIIEPRASGDFQEPSTSVLKARIPQLVEDAAPAPPVSTFVGDVVAAPYA